MTSKTQSLALFRSLLRTAGKINNYNFRKHAMRRTKSCFQESRVLASDEAATKYAWGMDQLKLMERVQVLGTLYPDENTVMQSL